MASAGYNRNKTPTTDELLDLVKLENLGDNVFLMTFNFITFTDYGIEAINLRLDELDEVEGGLCLITTSNHPRTYSAGLNMDNFMQPVRKVQSFLGNIQRLFARFMKLSYPTIAAINGHCFAAGLMLAFAHDFRIMAKTDIARLCLSEINIGMSLPPGMAILIRNKLSHKVFKEMASFGRKYSPEECLELDIVDQISLPDSLISDAKTIAYKYKEKSEFRTEFAAIKKVMNQEAIDAAENQFLPIVGHLKEKL